MENVVVLERHPKKPGSALTKCTIIACAGRALSACHAASGKASRVKMDKAITAAFEAMVGAAENQGLWKGCDGRELHYMSRRLKPNLHVKGSAETLDFNVVSDNLHELKTVFSRTLAEQLQLHNVAFSEGQEYEGEMNG